MAKKLKIKGNTNQINEIKRNNTSFENNINNNYFNEEYFNEKLYKNQYNQISKVEIIKSTISENISELLCIDKRNIIKKETSSSSFNSYFLDKDDDTKSISTTVSENSKKSFNYKKIMQLKELTIRKSYYQKLIQENVYSENILKKLNYNIFIIDWDDTLFPTTFINNNSNTSISKEIIESIDIMETSVIELLTKISRKGYVFIITNSNNNWINNCIDKYYPNIKNIIKKIDIISARDLYEKEFPSNGKIWKEKTFLKIKKDFELKKDNIINILCIGDSDYEIEAGKILAKEFDNSVIKSIKLKTQPNIKEIIKEINWLNKEINKIFLCAKNMSVYLD